MYTKVESEKTKTKGISKRISDHYKYLSANYDLNFMKYEIFSSIIAIVIFGIVLALQYKMPFADPIGRQKGIFLTVQILTIIIAIFMMGVIARHTKLKDSMLKNFLAYSTFLLIVTLCQGVFLGYMIKDYRAPQFEEFYQKYEAKDEDGRTKLSISSTGVTESTAKKDYVETSKSAFMFFVIRVLLLILLELIILGFAFYVVYKLVRTTQRLAATNTNAAV